MHNVKTQTLIGIFSFLPWTVQAFVALKQSTASKQIWLRSIREKIWTLECRIRKWEEMSLTRSVKVTPEMLYETIAVSLSARLPMPTLLALCGFGARRSYVTLAVTLAHSLVLRPAHRFSSTARSIDWIMSRMTAYAFLISFLLTKMLNWVIFLFLQTFSFFLWKHQARVKEKKSFFSDQGILFEHLY